MAVDFLDWLDQSGIGMSLAMTPGVGLGVEGLGTSHLEAFPGNMVKKAFASEMPLHPKTPSVVALSGTGLKAIRIAQPLFLK